MHELLSFALLAFSAIFVIVDPVGVVPLFLSLTAKDSVERRRQLARRACLVAWGVMITFALVGARLLALFGLSLDSFRIAGGLLMLVTAFDQLRAEPPRTRSTEAEEHESAEKDDISVVPLAMPILAGPGAIATAMVVMTRATSPLQGSLVLVAITVTMLVAYAAMHHSGTIARMLGTTGQLVLERLIGLLIAAIGIQFILDGMRAFLRS